MTALLGIGLLCVAEASWIQVKATAAQALINAAWNRNRQGAEAARPWPWADTTPVARLTLFRAADAASSSHPDSRLTPGDESSPPNAGSPSDIARHSSGGRDPLRTSVRRSRGESFVVLEGMSGRNLAFGPTHDAASVLPGDVGNSVIAAHRDTHFRALEGVQLGDRLRVERRDGRTQEFVVTDLRVADSRDTRIDLAFDQPRLTLVTCYPFHAIQPGGPLRYVVTADLSADAGHSPPPSVAHAAASTSLPVPPSPLPAPLRKTPWSGSDD